MSVPNFKTPRTLITEYLEASKTQTVRPHRAKDRLVRTPEVNIGASAGSIRSPGHATRSPGNVFRSPGRNIPKHDRVSSLRGKRTRSLTSLTDENTPRTLIEGYLAGEDSTAPAVRHLRRTSQTVYSASQPVGSPAKRRTLDQSRRRDPDSETPRTLIQNYLRNATNVIETPVVLAPEPSPVFSPNIPSILGSEQYDTPSPFKSSSQSSKSNVTEGARRSARKKNSGKFHLTVERSAEQSNSWETSSPSEVIEPVSLPNTSYQVPSPFGSSSESETDIFVSQNPRQLQDKSRRKTAGNFNIAVPQEILERPNQVPATSELETFHHTGRDSYSDEWEEEIIPETQSERGTTHQEQHIIYDLPMKPVDETSFMDDEFDNSAQDYERARRSGGRSRLSSIEVNRRADGFEKSLRISDSSAIDRISFDKSRRSSMLHRQSDDFDEGQNEVEMEYNEKTLNSSRARYHEGLRGVREEIMRDGRINSDNRNMDEKFEEIYERHRARDGRWSEGHELQETMPRDVKSARYSDGQLRLGDSQRSPGQPQYVKYLGNEPVHQVSSNRSKSPSSSVGVMSVSSHDLVPSSRRSRSPNDPSFEQLFSYQKKFLSQSPRETVTVQDENVDNEMMQETSHSESRKRSKQWLDDNEHYDDGQDEGGQGYENHFDMDVDGDEEQISPSGAGYINTLPDNTANFSPRISSTQRLASLSHYSPASLSSKHPSQRQSRNASIGNFFPRMSSTQKGESISDAGTTVIARSSHGHIQNLPNNITSFSPRRSSTQKKIRTTGNMGSDSQIDAVTPSPVVSPQRDSLTPAETPGSSARGRPKNSYSGNLEVSSPLDTVTPSPVVSPPRNSMSPPQTPGSSAQKTRTPSSGIPKKRIPASSIQRINSSGSRSLRSNTSLSSVQMSKTSSAQNTRHRIVSAEKTDTRISSVQKTETRGSSVQKKGTRTLSSQRASSKRRRISTLENSASAKNNSISQFSPKISSTQKGDSTLDEGITVIARKQQGHVQAVPNTTAAFSPRMSSTQRMHTSASNMEDGSPLDTATPSPVISPEMGGASASQNSAIVTRRDMWKDHSVSSGAPERAEIAEVPNNSAAERKKTKPRRKRSKPQYSLPVSSVKKTFNHFAGMRVSKEAVEEVMKASEIFWDNLAATLEAYAKHAGRKTINMSDFVLLFKRQGLVNEKQSMNSLIEKYLPMEEREKLIPVARAFNRIEPKL